MKSFETMPTGGENEEKKLDQVFSVSKLKYLDGTLREAARVARANENAQTVILDTENGQVSFHVSPEHADALENAEGNLTPERAQEILGT